jgi:hypothetical protein
MFCWLQNTGVKASFSYNAWVTRIFFDNPIILAGKGVCEVVDNVTLAGSDVWIWVVVGMFAIMVVLILARFVQKW